MIRDEKGGLASNHEEEEERDGPNFRLVRSESKRIRRNPSTDYTPPLQQRKRPLFRSASGNDPSVVILHDESAESRRHLEHSQSAPASGFLKYLGNNKKKSQRAPATAFLKHLRNNKKKSPPRGISNQMPRLSEGHDHEWNGYYDDENEPLLKVDSSVEDSLSSSFGCIESSPEDSPSLRGIARERTRQEQHELYQMAVAYLMDHQMARPPTLPPDHVSSRHLVLHKLRFSKAWNALIFSAMASLFLASAFENKRGRGTILLLLTFYAVLVFFTDMVMMKLLFGLQHSSKVHASSLPTLQFRGSSRDGGSVQAFLSSEQSSGQAHARKSRSRWWALPLSVFLLSLSIETLLVVIVHDNSRVIWTSTWKPIVLFYASPKARNALDAMNRVARIVFKVLFMELFLIFTFGAVACQLYGVDFESYGGLAKSFLSMYEISTLVATPGLWMPVVNKHPSCAFFFCFYLVTCVFYLHSLVLSVVFQSYMEGLSIIRDHAANDKEETLRLAFQTLYRSTFRGTEKPHSDTPVTIHTKSIKKVLVLMRPNYGREKINALLNIVDPSQSSQVDYNAFRSLMPKAMITTVRSARLYSHRTLAIEIFEAILAIANLAFVVLASSTYESSWWEAIVVPVGETITLLCLGDLVFRLFYSRKHGNSLPEAWEPDATFDLLAVQAVIVSVIGLLLHRSKVNRSLDWMVTGRAIDQMRFLRLAREARGIVRRSGELLPYVVGPVVLVVTALHMITYLCMSIWGGAVVVGQNTNIPPFYDLNNFNSFSSGIMTIFNMLVANDWHLLAKVFVLPAFPNKSKLVYPFFIGVNIIIVSILLNVLTAFFVGAFVTRTSWRRKNETPLSPKRTSVATVNSTMLPLPRMSRQQRTVSIISSDGFDDDSSVPEDITMSMRQDFDDVLKATMGKGDHDGDDDAAKYCCHLLELYETLSSNGEDSRCIGYLVSCQQSMSRYGNSCFQQMVHKYMDDEALHLAIDDMHSELAMSPVGHETSVHRTFLSPDEDLQEPSLELTASILKEGSSVALFLAKFV